MVKVIIDRLGTLKDKEFGYLVRTEEVVTYGKYFYQNRARVIEGHLLLEATNERGSDPKYWQFGIKTDTKKANKILYEKAREKASEFLE